MVRIGLISDTHGWLDERIQQHFDDCDEIWHAGDFGNQKVVDMLNSWSPVLRGVYGNIDGQEIRASFPETSEFDVEDLKVFMKHIGGYPGRYAPGVKKEIEQIRPALFISGHSHILKIIYDDKLDCLHINPGAAGKQGWHQVRTVVKFIIDGKDIRNCAVVELGKRY